MQGLHPHKLAYFRTELYTKGFFSSGSNSRQVKLSHETTDALCHFVSVVTRLLVSLVSMYISCTSDLRSKASKYVYATIVCNNNVANIY